MDRKLGPVVNGVGGGGGSEAWIGGTSCWICSRDSLAVVGGQQLI